MSVVPTDSQSRIEKLLSDLLNENTSDISPQSRNEAFLLGLINKVVPDITPVSRVECYLKALCEKNAGSSGGGGGGGSSSMVPKDVNFYDYDGTLVASYSLSEAQSLTALPDGPTHPGLTFQGWNYTLENINALTRPMNVGAIYITDDGKTRLHIRIWDTARSLVPLYISQTVANGVTIDWGDGSATQTLAGTGNVNATHQYTAVGDYTVTLAPAEGCTLGLGTDSTSYCVMGSTGNNGKVYCNLLQDVQIGANVTSIDNAAFYNCHSLANISIPAGVTSINNYALQYCYALSSVTIPAGVKSIGSSAFTGCYSLSSISIPAGVTSIGYYAFQNCYPLSSVTIPAGVTSIGNSAFSSCPSLSSVTIPAGVKSIANDAFSYCHSLASVTIPASVKSINSSVFSYCPSLSSVTIPAGVKSIGSSAFQNCYGMAEYHLKPTTPPTLSNTNAFNGIPSDCIIYVPKGCLEAYQNATNWATYASKMQEEAV